MSVDDAAEVEMDVAPLCTEAEERSDSESASLEQEVRVSLLLLRSIASVVVVDFLRCPSLALERATLLERDTAAEAPGSCFDHSTFDKLRVERSTDTGYCECNVDQLSYVSGAGI